MTSPQAIASDAKFGDCSIRGLKLHADALVIEFENDNTSETASITFRDVSFFQVGSAGSVLILDRIDFYESLAACLELPRIRRIVSDDEDLPPSALSKIGQSSGGVYHLVPLAGRDGIVVCGSADMAPWAPPH